MKGVRWKINQVLSTSFDSTVADWTENLILINERTWSVGSDVAQILRLADRKPY